MKKALMVIGIAGVLLTGGVAIAEPAAWLTDFAQAKKLAAEKKVPMLAVFTGSDWCTWCNQLDKEVLSKDEFANFAKESVILFQADFPNSKKLPEALTRQNQQLAEKYAVESFPTVLILNPEGKIIAKTGFVPGGAAKYVKHLKSLIKG